MCKATLEIFWPPVTGLCNETKADNIDDRDALSSARIGALSGGDATATLSDGYRVRFISDDCEPKGYRTVLGDGSQTNNNIGPYNYGTKGGL